MSNSFAYDKTPTVNTSINFCEYISINFPQTFLNTSGDNFFNGILLNNINLSKYTGSSRLRAAS